RLNTLQLFPQVCFDCFDIVEHAICFNCFKRGEYSRHREHATTKSGAQIIFLYCGSCGIRHQASANRNTTSKCLRKRNDVRYHVTGEFAPGKEPITGATYACLYFIED